ncbi:MAG: protein kinase [Myxococcota bacterium]
MLIIARILLLPVSLLLLAFGSFGLLVHYGAESDLADQARTGLQNLTYLAAEKGVDLPHGFVAGTEAWTADSMLRFALMPLGLVLMAFCMGLFRSAEKAAPEAQELHAEGGESKPDKRVAKKYVKQAKALRKQGKGVEAGELLWHHELLDEAAEAFIDVGEFGRAAEIRHDQNRFIESAELHEQAENYESAGSIFGQEEEWGRAADCYLKAGHQSVAAEMFEKAGKYREAAESYRATEFMRHAAAMYVKCRSWLAAAECLEQLFSEEGGKAMMDPKKSTEMSKLVRQAGKLFLKADEPERAYQILKRGECPLEAGEVAVMLGDHESAAIHFRQANDVERAAECLRETGQDLDAARMMGQHYRDTGEHEKAAELLVEAGDFMEAGDLFRSMNQPTRAAECYAEHNGFAQAAEMYSLAGDRESAGDAFEKAGRFEEGAECFALAGNAPREAALLEKSGEFLRAGETFRREGMDEESIAVLQKVPQEDEDFGRAAAILGDIFASRGQLPIAITKLQQAIGDTELTRDSVDSYFKLASIYQEDGKNREAVEIFEKVMAFDYHFGDVEERLTAARAKLAEEEPPPTATAAPAETPAAAAAPVTAPPSAGPGRYRVVGELGRGGMGIVYKAQDTVLDRLVAFKVLPQALIENEQAVQNFMREAQAAAKLNHPNIVTVYDTGEQDGRFYIAMEYVEGTTLKEILRRKGAISPTGILHVLMQMSEALAYAHEKKVVHRDIKPANAMWTREKKAKLMDFGLAKVVEEARNHTTVVAGTPYYMSPEQTLGKNIDHRTDIYSLGVAIFEMATGTVPFKEGNIPYHHVHTEPPRILDIRPDLPGGISDIVERCLQKDPGNRFQSAGEILAEVRKSLLGTL